MLIYYSKHSTRLIKDTLQDLCRIYAPIANEQATPKAFQTFAPEVKQGVVNSLGQGIAS